MTRKHTACQRCQAENDRLRERIERLEAQLAGADASHRRAEAENDRLREQISAISGAPSGARP